MYARCFVFHVMACHVHELNSCALSWMDDTGLSVVGFHVGSAELELKQNPSHSVSMLTVIIPSLHECHGRFAGITWRKEDYLSEVGGSLRGIGVQSLFEFIYFARHKRNTCICFPIAAEQKRFCFKPYSIFTVVNAQRQHISKTFQFVGSVPL